jgi:hypothetical protein
LSQKREDRSKCPNWESEGLSGIDFHEKGKRTGKEVRPFGKETERSDPIYFSQEERTLCRN